MAIKWMTLTCDWCGDVIDEFEDTFDAVEAGWWFLDSPAGDKCFCSQDCLEQWLPTAVIEPTEGDFDFDFFKED